MRPNEVERNVTVQGALSTSMFGIRQEDTAHVLSILRDKLYSNKILAVLREYASNAWDAHREAGKSDVPIIVNLPTVITPHLSIRDFGAGLAEEDVMHLYTQYGASSKRDSDNVVGMLGIGCKSAFAYNDSFSVTSWYGGVKKVYSAILDKSGVGQMIKLYEEECGDETGIEVQIPARPSDIAQFKREAEFLFSFFRPHPTINADLEDVVDRDLKHGFIRKNHIYNLPSWVAIMGCVPYQFTLSMLESRMDPQEYKTLASRYGGLYFDIGELDISADREKLEYTDRTLDILAERAKALLEDTIEEIKKKLEDLERKPETANKIASIQKRKIAREFSDSTGLVLPKHLRFLLDDEAKVYDRDFIPKTFWLTTIHRQRGMRGRRATDITKATHMVHIDYQMNCVVFLRDTGRKSLRGFSFTGTTKSNYLNIACLRPNQKVDEAEKELRALLDAALLTDAKIVRMSTLSWYSPYSRSENTKYAKELFEYIPGSIGNGSDRWEICEDPNSFGPDDVYVILGRFYPLETTYEYMNDILTVFDKISPESVPEVIFGVKTTLTKPITKEDVEGVYFTDWAKETLLRVIKVDKLFVNAAMAFTFADSRPTETALRMLKEGLGRHHPLTRIMSFSHDMYLQKTKLIQLNDIYNNRLYTEHSIIRSSSIHPDHRDRAKRITGIVYAIRHLKLHGTIALPAGLESFSDIEKRYPLIKKTNYGPGILRLLSYSSENVIREWIDYINYVDNR